MNWVDMTILIILIVNSLVGVKQGFIVSIFNLVGFILSYYFAKIYYPIVSEYIIANPDFFNKLKEFIGMKVQPLIIKNAAETDTGSILKNFKLPKPVMDGVLQNKLFGSYVQDMTDSISSLITETLTHMFVNIISFLIVFAIAQFVLMIIVRVLDSFVSLPILNQFNKLLGVGTGFIKGILVVYLILAVLTPIISFSPDGAIANGVFNSTFGYYLYDNNILLKYLKEYWVLS